MPHLVDSPGDAPDRWEKLEKSGLRRTGAEAAGVDFKIRPSEVRIFLGARQVSARVGSGLDRECPSSWDFVTGFAAWSGRALTGWGG